jgi:alkaline phosphatase
MRIIIPLLLLALFAGCSQEQTEKSPAQPVFRDGDVKNIIFMIGDGMGLGQIAYVQLQELGADLDLALQTLPVTGLVKTHSADNLITDSAAGATAMASGHKTNNQMLGLNADSLLVTSIMEMAQDKGLATGVVATSGVTHAPPAAFLAHHPSRHAYPEIAEQLLASKAQVILGGGKKYFRPQSEAGSGRTDDKDLLSTAAEAGFQVALTRDELLAAENSERLLGLFSEDGLKNGIFEPELFEMTEIALRILSRDKDGFFLMVEGSQIDWAGHANDPAYLIREQLSFDRALAQALAFADQHPGTLIVVTADHETGGLVINGGAKGAVEISWASESHSGTPVPIFAYGPGAYLFTGFMDNTEIPVKMSRLLNLNGFPAHARKK